MLIVTRLAGKRAIMRADLVRVVRNADDIAAADAMETVSACFRTAIGVRFAGLAQCATYQRFSLRADCLLAREPGTAIIIAPASKPTADARRIGDLAIAVGINESAGTITDCLEATESIAAGVGDGAGRAR